MLSVCLLNTYVYTHRLAGAAPNLGQRNFAVGSSLYNVTCMFVFRADLLIFGN